jgi:hypothetical protein
MAAMRGWWEARWEDKMAAWREDERAARRTRGRCNQTTSVLKFIIPLILLCKLTESSLSFDSEPIQLFRIDDQSTVTIFLHLNFSERIVMQNANPNEVTLQPMLWRYPIGASIKSTIFTSTSNVPVKRFCFNFLIEKPHFVWKWARWAATRRCSYSGDIPNRLDRWNSWS